jgi:prepilin-type N-terminal cleavage/methylation domain-containing protein
MHESFWDLLMDPAHWYFELFLIFIFDVVIGLIIWPFISGGMKHHKSDHQRLEDLEKEVERLKVNNLKRGFTLIELLVVISIIGVMSTVVMMSTGTSRLKSRDAQRLSDIRQINLALEVFYSVNGKYPSNVSPGFNMYADSRNPPNSGVPAYSNLMSQLVPTYLPRAPIPPKNNSGDGLMCSNCDEYRYFSLPYGTGFSLCTYLAETKNMTGQNAYGPYYCIVQGCVASGNLECT